jgi:hypothetical protein
MFKVDKIKNFFDCDLCHKVLVDPISIPCGNNVCKGHLDNLLKNVSKEKSFYQCEICQEEHFIPKNGSKVDKRLQRSQVSCKRSQVSRTISPTRLLYIVILLDLYNFKCFKKLFTY